jgi:hypothetical protein
VAIIRSGGEGMDTGRIERYGGKTTGSLDDQ